MKLYFYFLDVRKDNCIRMEECEVEEKAKTYRPVNGFPAGFYHAYVKKDDIGRSAAFNQNLIILAEKNVGRVAEAFICRFEYTVSREERRIQLAEKEIEQSKSAISALEKWRSENAGE